MIRTASAQSPDTESTTALDRAHNHFQRLYGEDPQILLDYLNFLDQRSQDASVVPDDRVDNFWHLHILDMANYISFCRQRYGELVLHSLSGEDKAELRTHYVPHSTYEGTSTPTDPNADRSNGCGPGGPSTRGCGPSGPHASRARGCGPSHPGATKRT